MTLVALVAFVVVVYVSAARASRATEYKVVVLATRGVSMPSLTESLNLEAERGYELVSASADDGALYLVFKK